MALSKSTRITILLVIDCVFFLIELITGYAVHSLALVADSFHMLNDVLSLCVGLWAVRVANQRGSSKTYTYGWQRAETLGALVNGVFLVALCVTIFLDAVQRFFEPQEVTRPMLVLIVGCLGLGSNILGLVLFHDHGHSHGGHSHGGEDAEDHIHAAEEGHGSHSHAEPTPITAHTPESDTTAVESGSPTAHKSSSASRQSPIKRRHSRSQSRTSMLEEIPSNATAIRNSIIYRSRLEPVDSEDDQDGEEAVDDDESDTHRHSEEPLLNGKKPAEYGAVAPRKSIDHRKHHHAQPAKSGHGGHSHGDLNMRGIFLHVMGDALGNLGVIASALVIWLTHYSWRFYFDPAISLVITCIILASAIPLCKAASRILLQAVPAGIDVDHIQEDIEDLEGVISCHHLHVWQLSDTKKVASLHVQVNLDVGGEGSASYMALAQDINKCLRAYGIFSSTIQPEFCLDPEHDHTGNDVDGADDDSGCGRRVSKPNSRIPSKAASLREPDPCLLDSGSGCCDPPPKDGGGIGGHGHVH